ncbi:hypothetical protein V1460_15330 [Streptomyces sp. SCSIO 30461]|uniref:hypothetical protein n=1 Tax=Streptomyces sp. SCSIO 30461 TaxID=3118085 RepID=UPI0030D374CF
MARVALREPGLPRASLAGPARDVELLADHRRRLARSRTAAANKLRWFPHEIDPELPVPSRPGISGELCVFDALTEALVDHDGVVAEIARDLVEEYGRLTAQINAMEARLPKPVEKPAPSLLEIPGCGVIIAEHRDRFGGGESI